MANQQLRPTAPEARLRLSIAPDPRLGGYVRQELLNFAAVHGLEGESLLDFITAIGEALANAIEHAHSNEPIEIAAWMLGDDRLFASVKDHGIGFAPRESAFFAGLPDAYAERGRGLLIMRRYADLLSIRSVPGKGTLVTLGYRACAGHHGERQHAAG